MKITPVARRSAKTNCPKSLSSVRSTHLADRRGNDFSSYGVPFRAERPHHGEIAALVGQEPHRYFRARLRPGATSTVSSWASVSAA